MSSSKKRLTTFQHIKENIPKDALIQNEITLNDNLVKERHEGLAIKFLPTLIKDGVNNNLYDDTGIISVESENLRGESEIKEINNKQDEQVKDNNLKKFSYTCITLLLENNVMVRQRQLINFKQKLRLEIERKKRIDSLLKDNNSSIFKTRRELFKLHTKLKAIRKELDDNASMENEVCISKERSYVKFVNEIKEKEESLQILIEKQKELSGYIFVNKNYIKALKHNINNFDNEMKEKSMQLKMQKKEKALKDLDTTIKNTTSEKQRRILIDKELKLDKELKILKQKNDQVVTKIYEEIVLQENYLYFITTLVHNDGSITEEVIYFENDKTDEPIVWTQIKKYRNINEYEKDDLIVAEISDDNINNFTSVPIKKFLLDLEETKNKISKSEWILFFSITILSIALLTTAPVVAPFIVAIVWEKALVGAIGVGIAWIVNKGIGALVADKTKKVEAWMKKKVFSWMRKIFKKRSIGKTKEELDIKNNISKLTENLTSEKLETRLSTQFSILKDVVIVRKDRKATELIDEKENLKSKNDITLIDNKNFNANKVNDFDSQSSTSTDTKQCIYSL